MDQELSQLRRDIRDPRESDSAVEKIVLPSGESGVTVNAGYDVVIDSNRANDTFRLCTVTNKRSIKRFQVTAGHHKAACSVFVGKTIRFSQKPGVSWNGWNGLKMNDEFGMHSSDTSEIAAKHVKLIPQTIGQPIPIVDPSILTTDVASVEFYYLKVLDRRCLPELIMAVGRIFPFIADFGHLKRVKKMDDCFMVLVCQSCKERMEDVKDKISSGIGRSDLDVATTYAPHCPGTRKQFEAARQIWPCSFRENKTLEKLISGNYFSDLELEYLARWIGHVTKLARNNDLQNACAMVNSTSGTLEGSSEMHVKSVNPLHHSVMVAIGQVAQTQADAVVTRDIDNAILHRKRDNQAVTQCNDSYLCSGMDCFVTVEPCMMCSMALVHSRIARVFYCHPNQAGGALGSVANLHYESALNHHFQVFHCVDVDCD